MLTHIKKIIKLSNKLAVGAFNTYNLEFTKGIVAAAVKEKLPIIIQVSENTLKYTGIDSITAIIKSVAEKEGKNVPMAIHLDHGKDIDFIKKAIEAGFQSVMFDGSLLPFEENVKLTKKVVDYAHQRGVWVQGELGEVIVGRAGIISDQTREQGMTNPVQAQEFVKETKVDALAVAIGNVHGVYKLFSKVPKLNIELLKTIQQKVKVPLVLHGGSGINNKDVKKAIQNGIRVINVNSELKLAFANALRKALRNNSRETDPRKILDPCVKEVQRIVSKKIELFSKI